MYGKSGKTCCVAEKKAGRRIQPSGRWALEAGGRFRKVK